MCVSCKIVLEEMYILQTAKFSVLWPENFTRKVMKILCNLKDLLVLSRVHVLYKPLTRSIAEDSEHATYGDRPCLLLILLFVKTNS